MVGDPGAFVADWLNGWNTHDLDRVLAHFHENVTFTSPVAAAVLPGSGGVLRGKAALREYWTKGLELIPDLHFTVEATHVGVAALVIGYRNQRGVLVQEVLVFDGDLVLTGHGTYPLGGADDPAGLAP